MSKYNIQSFGGNNQFGTGNIQHNVTVGGASGGTFRGANISVGSNVTQSITQDGDTQIVRQGDRVIITTPDLSRAASEVADVLESVTYSTPEGEIKARGTAHQLRAEVPAPDRDRVFRLIGLASEIFPGQLFVSGCVTSTPPGVSAVNVVIDGSGTVHISNG
jgi:hypothetical protein